MNFVVLCILSKYRYEERRVSVILVAAVNRYAVYFPIATGHFEASIRLSWCTTSELHASLVRKRT